MNSDELRRAYAEFLDAVQRRHYHAPAHGGWSADLVLAHVVVGDRVIAEAAARVILGEQVHFDNLASQSEPYLRALIAAAGDWDGLIAAVKRGGEELVGLVEALTPAQAATSIPTRIVSDGKVVIDGAVPLQQLVNVPATTHLRMHLQQIAALGESEARGVAHASSA